MASGCAGVIVCLLAWGVPGAGHGQTPPAATALEDTLRVGTLQSWPPHYLTDADGRPGGFAVDMMRAVASRAGFDLEFVVLPDFPAAVAALESDIIDVIPDFGVAEERMGTVRFTRPFGAFRLAIIKRRTDGDLDLSGGLAGRRIGVVASNAGEWLVPAAYPGAELVRFQEVREALVELLAAGVEGVAYPDEVFLALASSAGVEDRLEVLEPALAEIPRAMAVRSADSTRLARLDAALDAVIATSEYEVIYRRWFGRPTPVWTARRVAIGAAVLMAVLLLAMGLWRYRSVSKVARDLTRSLAERDAAQRALDDAHRTLRLTLASLDSAVFVVDPAARTISDCNAAAEAMFGRARDQLLGGATRMLHVDDEAYAEFARVSEAVLRQGQTFRGEFTMRRADGSVFPTRNTVSLLDSSRGLDGGVVSVVHDVTEQVAAQESLRESEERFRQLAERIRDVFWISAPDKDRLEYVSPAYEEIWGLPPDSLYQDARGWLNAIHPEDRTRVEEALPDQSRDGYEIEYRIIRPDGEVRWIRDRAFPVRDASGEVHRVVGVARDVTEERRALEERESLGRQLRQSQRLEAVGRLAGGIAHDFNNLLTVIRSQTDLVLLDLAESDPVAEDLRVVQAAADKAAAVTGQLLAFSRDQVLRPQVVDLGTVVRDITILLARIIGEDIKMELDLRQGLPPVRLDPGQLEQVVMNLGVNARDAMPEGGRLTLRTFRRKGPAGEQEGDEVDTAEFIVLEVTDTGVGMDAETRRHIFEPFFTTKQRDTGTGLGLAMVYGFVKQSGGHITVQSEVGRGTTFLLSFPAVQGTPDAVARPDQPRPGARATSTGRIILVEDDPSVRRVTRRILEHAGFQTEPFEDGESALAALEDGLEADALLTDLGLPGMGGRTLLDRVRQVRPELPLAAMSGYAVGSPGKLEDLPQDVVFIQKPFTGDDLIAQLRGMLADR